MLWVYVLQCAKCACRWWCANCSISCGAVLHPASSAALKLTLASIPTSPVTVGFVEGSLGAMVGATVAHPFDLIKVRLQLQGEAAASGAAAANTAPRVGILGMGQRVVKSDGVKGLFRGVSASLARQAIYSGTRFYMYGALKGAVQEKTGKPLGGLTMVGCAALAGSMGAFAGNPGDLAMVRMQADGKLPVGERRNYKNIFDAVSRIAREEGITRLWTTGVGPNLTRAAIVTVGHLAAYDKSKSTLIDTVGLDPKKVTTHFAAALSSAAFTSFISHPIDVAKSRIMTSPQLYSGVANCLATTVAKEGPLALYKGFGATVSRQAPYVIVTWMTIEQIRKLHLD